MAALAASDSAKAVLPELGRPAMMIRSDDCHPPVRLSIFGNPVGTPVTPSCLPWMLVQHLHGVVHRLLHGDEALLQPPLGDLEDRLFRLVEQVEGVFGLLVRPAGDHARFGDQLAEQRFLEDDPRVVLDVRPGGHLHRQLDEVRLPADAVQLPLPAQFFAHGDAVGRLAPLEQGHDRLKDPPVPFRMEGVLVQHLEHFGDRLAFQQHGTEDLFLDVHRRGRHAPFRRNPFGSEIDTASRRVCHTSFSLRGRLCPPPAHHAVSAPPGHPPRSAVSSSDCAAVPPDDRSPSGGSPRSAGPSRGACPGFPSSPGASPPRSGRGRGSASGGRAAICFRRYGRHCSTSPGCGFRLPGGRHLRMLQM